MYYGVVSSMSYANNMPFNWKPGLTRVSIVLDDGHDPR